MSTIENLEKSLLEKEIQAQKASCMGKNAAYISLVSEISTLKHLLIQKISHNTKAGSYL